jgi:hypothetical protein
LNFYVPTARRIVSSACLVPTRGLPFYQTSRQADLGKTNLDQLQLDEALA